ncbi:MAG: carboxyl-terminal protease [Bacteroidia bacterium]|nr:carboxyl-terminal protease [Bacteroidia bacterium]NNK59364.1 carboxyl-terminal protease [Flavobacteriaceae bacterium]RZW57811.1 MAG: carboxyl-terminal protease [Flavobacteriaceae bacterium]
MKIYTKVILLFVLVGMLTSCFEDRDDNGIFASEINDFVWKGMNAVYLYKDNIPDLANDRFSSDQEYSDYLNSFPNPESIFESLIYNRTTVDKYSWIVDDYIALEQLFDGVSKSNGMEFGLRFVPGSSTDVYGYVRYVLPNTSAESQGIQRGDVFYGIDGTPLTESNFSTLLANDTYSIDLATYDNNGTPQTDDDSIIPGSESISLTKAPYTKNPLFHSEIIDVNGENVGYLMYNGFTADFDSQLNAAFGDFLGNNVQHLVLDLRYNPGGSVNSSILLSSMITGQFTGEVYSTEQWNSELQEAFFNQNPESLINRFTNNDDGSPLNSLNLNTVYILTTGSSASASELVINCLNPYIDVIQIGTTTTGKYQASVTLYDSPNFGRDNANPNHTYAMQPLVLKSLNSVGFTDYDNGLVPDITLEEDISNLGVIGDQNEPLLQAALDDISGVGRIHMVPIQPEILVGDSNDFVPFAKDMYIEKSFPDNLRNDLQN